MILAPLHCITVFLKLKYNIPFLLIIPKKYKRISLTQYAINWIIQIHKYLTQMLWSLFYYIAISANWHAKSFVFRKDKEY